jgi:hypothetical protein
MVEAASPDSAIVATTMAMKPKNSTGRSTEMPGSGSARRATPTGNSVERRHAHGERDDRAERERPGPP